MSIHSRSVIADANGGVRIPAEIRKDLMIARSALELLYGGEGNMEDSALLQNVDMAAHAYVTLLKTLRSIGEQLRAGVSPGNVVRQIDGALGSVAPAAQKPPPAPKPAESAGEGEV